MARRGRGPSLSYAHRLCSPQVFYRMCGLRIYFFLGYRLVVNSLVLKGAPVMQRGIFLIL